MNHAAVTYVIEILKSRNSWIQTVEVSMDRIRVELADATVFNVIGGANEYRMLSDMTGHKWSELSKHYLYISPWIGRIP